MLFHTSIKKYRGYEIYERIIMEVIFISCKNGQSSHFSIKTILNNWCYRNNIPIINSSFNNNSSDCCYEDICYDTVKWSNCYWHQYNIRNELGNNQQALGLSHLRSTHLQKYCIASFETSWWHFKIMLLEYNIPYT